MNHSSFRSILFLFTTLISIQNTLACCSPGGACCVGKSGNACFVDTKAECDAVDGKYQGDSTTCAEPPIGKPVTYASATSLNIAIPDGGYPFNPATHTITVPDSVIVGDVNVAVTIEHQNLSDIMIKMSHAGRTVSLLLSPCITSSTSPATLNAVFDDEGPFIIGTSCVSASSTLVSSPMGDLSDFDGMDSTGDWTIEVSDSFVTKTGKLVKWSVQIDASPARTCKPKNDIKKMFCFSGENTVDIKNSGIVLMASLQIGDCVRTTNEEYSRVYGFAHLNYVAETDYLRIFVKGLDSPLEVSPEHFIYISKKATRASEIKVGDVLDGLDEVGRVESVKRQGAYAPLTESGRIVVSGIHASNYVGILDHLSPMIQNMASHFMLSFRRITCYMNMDICMKESYTDGIANWLSPLHRVALVLGNLSAYLQMLAVFLIIPVAFVLHLVEQAILQPSYLVCILLLILSQRNRTKI